MRYDSTTDGSTRTFRRGNETYTVEVYWDESEPGWAGWAYRVGSDARGALDKGSLDTGDGVDDPWTQMEAIFPEVKRV